MNKFFNSIKLAAAHANGRTMRIIVAVATLALFAISAAAPDCIIIVGCR